MRFLQFNGSTTKILLPSAEERMASEDARDVLLDGEELAGCVVSGLDLADERLDIVAMRNCVVENANLANTVVDEVRLDRVVISESTLVGFQPRTMTVKESLVDTCRLDLAILSSLRVIAPSAVVACSMREADLSGAVAQECIFHECDLTGADLRTVRFDGADLRGSSLTGALGLSTLRRVVLDPDQLTDLLLDLQRGLGISVHETDAGPTVPWREAPER